MVQSMCILCSRQLNALSQKKLCLSISESLAVSPVCPACLLACLFALQVEAGRQCNAVCAGRCKLGKQGVFAKPRRISKRARGETKCCLGA